METHGKPQICGISGAIGKAHLWTHFQFRDLQGMDRLGRKSTASSGCGDQWMGFKEKSHRKPWECPVTCIQFWDFIRAF